MRVCGVMKIKIECFKMMVNCVKEMWFLGYRVEILINGCDNVVIVVFDKYSI